MHLYFDRNNPANWFEFLLWHENSNKFIWICVLTKEINLINMYRLLITFSQIKFTFWQEKSDKFICICVLTETIQQIDLNFCFDIKIQTNLFEFVFWQRKSIWSIFTGYLLHFFKSICFFDRKNPEIELNFVFWLIKSNEFICICVLTGKTQQIDLNFSSDMKIQTNLFEFWFIQRESIWFIITGYLLHFFKSNLLFVFWQVKSNKIICIFVLTEKSSN